MQTKTNYLPHGGRMAHRTLLGAIALGGLVTAMGPAANAAPVSGDPSVTITERSATLPITRTVRSAATKPAAAKLAAAKSAIHLASPRPIGEMKASPFILQVAERRLSHVATRLTAGV